MSARLRYRTGLPLAVFALFLLGGTPACAQSPPPPEARRVDQVDTYHGVAVADPYRWMEALESEELTAWMQAEEAHRAALMGEDGLAERLAQRLTDLGHFATQSLPIRQGPRTFVIEAEAGTTYGQLFVSEPDGARRMVLDLGPLNSDGQSAFISSYSPAGRYVTYNAAPGQSRWRTVHLVRVADGTLLPETLTGLYSGRSNLAWLRDESGFFYARYPVPDDPQAPLGLGQVYFHRVGTPQAEDVLVYERPGEVQTSYLLRVSHDGRYLLLEASEDGGSFTGLVPRLFYKDLHAPDGPVRELFAGVGALYTFEGNTGPRFLIRTTHEAPQGRLMAVDLAQPDPAHWEEIIPTSARFMQAVSEIGGRLVVQYIQDARMVAQVFDRAGQLLHEIDHLSPTLAGFADDPAQPLTYYRAPQLYAPATTYELDVRTGESRVYFRPELPHNPDDFVTEQVFFTSKDGTRVPLFLVHRKDLVRDGTAPVFLYGYGAWAWSAYPWQSHLLPWLEMGGIYAVPGIRGGGEYGADWHQAGIRQNKQTGIDDFIAAADYLIEANYTSAARLVANGGSASGILPGAAMIQRPNLFGAVVINFPTLDQLRYTEFGSAHSWIPEFGTAEDPDDFAALYAYSPYHNLENGTCYPPTWVQVGEKDDTTTPMHGYKFVAALRAAQGCANPVVLKIAWGAGHSYGLTPEQRRQTQAEELAFLVRVLGLAVPPALTPGAAGRMNR